VGECENDNDSDHKDELELQLSGSASAPDSEVCLSDRGHSPPRMIISYISCIIIIMPQRGVCKSSLAMYVVAANALRCDRQQELHGTVSSVRTVRNVDADVDVVSCVLTSFCIDLRTPA